MPGLISNDSVALQGQVETIDLLGLPLSVFQSYSAVVEWIVARVLERERTFCVAINPEKICAANRNPVLRQVIRSASLHICDGIGAAVAARVLHGRKVHRITGIQLFFHLLECAETAGLGVFLLGAKPEVNAAAAAAVKQKHPDIKIVGQHHGYFASDNDVLRRIDESHADLLFVAMGSPRQEEWIASHWDRMTVPFCMGVGGSFDVLAGNVKWAPPIYRRTGTEFLYRVLREPKRIRRIVFLPRFARLLCRAKFANGVVGDS